MSISFNHQLLHFNKKRQSFLVMSLALLGSQSFAGEMLRLSGPAATLGKVSSPQTVLSIRANPAAASILVNEKETMRYAYLSSLGGGVEIGDFENFEEEINDLIDQLERDDIGIEESEDLLDRFNAVLPVMGENGYLEFEFDVSLPAGPFVFHNNVLGGALFVDVSKTISAVTILLDDQLEFSPQSSNLVVGGLATDTSVYIKGADVTKFTLGYSRDVLKPQIGGTIITGASFNIYNAKLSKSVLRLEGFDGEEVSDVISDEYDRNEASNTSVGLDVGALWQFDDWHVGLTIENINEPKFDYGSLAQDCGSLPEQSLEQENCFAATTVFIDRINLAEEASLEAQSRLEGSYYALDRKWEFSGFYELNEVFDMLAIESQLMGVSVSYNPDNWLYPTFRIGFNQNLVGSELSRISLGTTLFSVVNFDISLSSDSTNVDGDDYPRSFTFNLGFEQLL